MNHLVEPLQTPNSLSFECVIIIAMKALKLPVIPECFESSECAGAVANGQNDHCGWCARKYRSLISSQSRPKPGDRI